MRLSVVCICVNITITYVVSSNDLIQGRLLDYKQEISNAANVPQKEIGKYIKILGEALQLSQPINSNSISVHMPRFCTLLQLNKSAQVPLLFDHIITFCDDLI